MPLGLANCIGYICVVTGVLLVFVVTDVPVAVRITGLSLVAIGIPFSLWGHERAREETSRRSR